MSYQLLLITAFSLSMDAFAVSITNGMCYKNVSRWKNSLSSGICFGFFQALMPLLGFFAGSLFSDLVEGIDHWIALILLGLIGGKMVADAIKDMRAPEACDITDFSFKTLLLQGIATSIDAFVIGIGFAVMNINIAFACSTIGIITLLFSFIGVHIGKGIGGFLSDKAQLIGGIILILIGIKIFYEHVAG